MKPGFILESYLSLSQSFPCVAMVVNHVLSDKEYSYAKLYAFANYGVSNIGIMVQS